MYLQNYVSTPEFLQSAESICSNFIGQYIENVEVKISEIQHTGILGLKLMSFQVQSGKSTIVELPLVTAKVDYLTLFSNPKFMVQMDDGNGGSIAAETTLDKEKGKFSDLLGTIDQFNFKDLVSGHFRESVISLKDWIGSGQFAIKNSTFALSGTTQRLSWELRKSQFKALKRFKKIPSTLMAKPFAIDFSVNDSVLKLNKPIQISSKLGKIRLTGVLKKRPRGLMWDATVRSSGSIFIPFMTKAIFRCPQRSGLNFDIKGPVNRPVCQRIRRR